MPTRQIVLVTTAVFVLVVSGCKTLKLDDTVEVQTISAMAESRHYVESSLADSLAEVWSYNAEAGFGQVAPLVFDEFVLVATRRGEVHIVDALTGKKVGSKKFGDAINGSPAVQRERLYVPVDFGGKKGIRAWDLRTGMRLFDLVSVAVETSILNLGDRIVFADTKSVVRCIDGSDGADIWSLSLDPRVAVSASPVLVNRQLIVVVNTKGAAVGIDPATGRQVGAFDVGESVYNAISTDGKYIFIPTVSGKLFAVAVGSFDVEMIFATDDETVQIASAAIGKDSIVLAGSDGIVRAIDRSDWSPQWETDVGFPVVAAPFIAGSRVYVATLGRTLTSLDMESGVVEDEHTLKGRVKSPMSVHDNALYVLSEPRYVYRFSGNANYVVENNSDR